MSSNKKKLYCFLDTIEAWNYVKKNYKNYKIVICTSSPEILFKKNLKEEVIILDEKNISVIKPLSRDLAKLTIKIFKKIRKLKLSHNFAIQYVSFILKFTNFLRFSTILDKVFFNNDVLIVKSNFKDSNITNTINFPIEKLLKKNKRLKIKKINILGSKFEKNFKSPNLLLRLYMNGLHNLEFLFWRKIWTIFPFLSNKKLVLLGLDGPFLRETAVYLSRYGYKFKTIPKFSIPRFKRNKTESINENIIKNIEFINIDVKKVFKKYLKPENYTITYDVFLNELFYFLKQYEFNVKYWKTYFAKKLNKYKVKCLLSTHLADSAFLGLAEYLEKNNIPIFNFQHGHRREISLPEFNNWGTILEPLADKAFVYNAKSKEVSENANKLAKGKYINIGVPSVYKKNNILFNKPRFKILFLSGSFFVGIRRAQLLTGIWSDRQRLQIEINLINKVFKKIPYELLYKTYPLYGNLSESVVKKEISICNNISLVKNNYDAHYFFYSKRIIITYGASSQLGWSLFSKLPLIFINTPDKPIDKSFKTKFKKSIFLFDYDNKNFFKDLNFFLSQPLETIYEKWKEKEKNRNLLMKDLSSENNNLSGKIAAKHILNMN